MRLDTPMPNNDRVGYRRYRGLTMTELVVAISIFVLVIALLGYPLFSAFSYIQKAIAQSEAQSSGNRTITQLTKELATADEIEEIPPTADMVNLLFAQGGDGNESGSIFGTAGDTSTATNTMVRFVRYARMPDFPWAYTPAANWTQPQPGWALLHPDYDQGTKDGQLPSPVDEYRYGYHHSAFYTQNDNGQPFNPYVLTRYEESGMSLSKALGTANIPGVASDSSYPMNEYPYQIDETAPVSSEQLIDLDKGYRGVLLSKYRNDMVSTTPYGADWDVSRFQVKPMRVVKETLVRPGSAVCTSLFAKYPLWSGRSMDLDKLDANSPPTLQTMYPLDTSVDQAIQRLVGIVGDPGAYPLFQLGPSNANPFGFQIQVFRSDGNLEYGFDSVGNFNHNRHFMDWPPIDRSDLILNNGFTTTAVTWSVMDIKAQRNQGKLVFEQPYDAANDAVQSPQALPVDSTTGYYYLPIPQNWDANLTYRVQAPRSITIGDKTYRLVDKDPSALKSYEFCFAFNISGLVKQKYGVPANTGLSNWGQLSREIILGSPPGTLTINNAVYTMCDLQPTDTVIATYCTRGMLDVGFTLSRKDHSGATAESSRQDYAVNLRIEARNAMHRARRQ